MTTPVAPMEARCEHCLDTGSLSKQMDGGLDCQYCEATTQRIALRNHLAQFTGWPQNDVTAWAAYLFAQRQAGPVAPAQQVEAAMPSIQALARIGEVLGTDEDEGGPLPILDAIEAMQQREKSVADLMRDWKTRATSSDDVCVALFGFFSSTPAIPATPQLEAQQAGDVVLKEAVAKFIKAKGRFHTEQNYAALVAAHDAIAQGRKA